VSVLVLDAVSRWYGDVVAVNGVSMTIGPGVTGLLGPNGAGKSTLIHLMSGFLAPSSGSVLLDGEPVWRNEPIYRRIGLVPEREGMYDMVTGRQFVLANARLQRLADPHAAARRALEEVELLPVQDRPVGTYSKGMKQRVKMATALVHDPQVLLLDEPFNGMDPRQRLHLMDLLQRLAAQGRTVLFSSHILEEVEQLAGTIQVMVAGRHAASGDFREIRRLMTARPHRYTIRSGDDRALAAALIAEGAASGVELAETLQVQTPDFARFCVAVAAVARRKGIRLLEVVPADESLESVFSYLVAGERSANLPAPRSPGGSGEPGASAEPGGWGEPGARTGGAR
jgi:ABC-2 type transport system ATP-binding protein